jgi:hypothetical protein
MRKDNSIFKARVGITRRFPLPDSYGRKWATVGSAHFMRSHPKDAGKQGMGRDDERAMENFVRWCARELAKSGDQLEPIEGGQFNVVPRTSR